MQSLTKYRVEGIAGGMAVSFEVDAHSVREVRQMINDGYGAYSCKAVEIRAIGRGGQTKFR